MMLFFSDPDIRFHHIQLIPSGHLFYLNPTDVATLSLLNISVSLRTWVLRRNSRVYIFCFNNFLLLTLHLRALQIDQYTNAC